MKEKREFIRLPAHHLIKYRVLEKEKAFSFARNISAGGILFYCKENIPVGSIVEVVINFPGRSEPIKVLSKVSRMKPLRKTGGFEAAARFINIDKDTQDFINNKILKVFREIKKR